MCPTRHFVYIFFNPVFQLSTAKNELFNKHVLIVAPVTFAPAGAMMPSADRHSGSVVERPLCDREVAGSIPGRVIPKTLKMVLAALSLGAQN